MAQLKAGSTVGGNTIATDAPGTVPGNSIAIVGTKAFLSVVAKRSSNTDLQYEPISEPIYPVKVYGFTSGGLAYPPVAVTAIIDRFPFAAPFTTASNIGSVSQTRGYAAGQSSSTNGYTSGGATPTITNVIDRFPFGAPFTTSTDVGDLSQARYLACGQSSTTDGYTSGGQPSVPTITNIIDSFPFSAPFVTATDKGDLSQSVTDAAGQQSSTDGYRSGGFAPPAPATPTNVIDKFPFSAPFVTATDMGDLSQARRAVCGQSSTTHGYTSGGFTPPATLYDNTPPIETGTKFNTIDRFPFTAPFVTATDVGNLFQSRGYVAGQSSSTNGYTSGGIAGGITIPPSDPVGFTNNNLDNTVDRFSFSAPFVTATDTGNLSAVRGYIAGHQY